MEMSVKAASVAPPPQPDVTSSPSDAAGAAGARRRSSDAIDPMEEFSRRLEEIVRTYGSAATLLDKQAEEPDVDKMKEEAKEGSTVTMETEVSLIMQSLNVSSSPEEKLGELVRKHAELAALRRRHEAQLSAVHQERQQLRAERSSSVAARGQLEALCRELQGHYRTLREEALQRCREDEEKRSEMTDHFQTVLTEIQAQIELHSARNDKLCRENANLTDKLESLMSQCEQREASLDKIDQHRELQSKLSEARLQQANALLAEAEEKHRREKEYLLREAIDKTKKCFAMKEQELSMKKKLTLYAQKFDEFQGTLAKSNEIYVRFKNEMEKMSEKMKKMEKESNLWKTRFENCNKALTDMIEERTEKSKEYDLFVLKIQKLERLCRALQDERKVLYDKIRDVRQANASLPSKVSSSEPLTPLEIQEIQDEDPVLTEDMARLKEEQAKLQQFADSLLAPAAEDKEDEDSKDADLEDLVASAFVQFKTKPQTKEQVEAETGPRPDEAQETSGSEAPPTGPNPEGSRPAEIQEEQVKPGDEIQQPEPAPESDSVGSDTQSQLEAAEPKVLEDSEEVDPVEPEEDETGPEVVGEATTHQPSASSLKQVPKKKKKRLNKNES
ncbi:beta-taxilin isoform X1 [Betta splendens]|uniref:Beta-taxilin isoform X1 n=1 Tax=Betta splendens TaxID=158456 RepID=A0A6P7LUW8_BETSP|nr:beta-taxilin isoform X1 [Betta splendens]